MSHTLAALMLSFAIAQPATQPGTTASSDADVLSGPRVTGSERHGLSIIEREFDGRLKRLEQHPVLVALDRMSLSPESRAKVDEVLQRRNSALDTLVRDNLKLIIELGLANQAGDKAASQALLAELVQKAQPFLQRGPLLNELRDALPAAQYRELRNVVEEYFEASRSAAKNDASGKRDRFGSLVAMSFEGVQYELKASYERVVQGPGDEFEKLIKELNLSPEQESRIRQKAVDFVQKTYGKPTKGQQVKIFLEIYGELTPEQRRILSRRIGQERRDEIAAKRHSQPRATPDADDGMNDASTIQKQ